MIQKIFREVDIILQQILLLVDWVVQWCPEVRLPRVGVEWLLVGVLAQFKHSFDIFQLQLIHSASNMIVRVPMRSFIIVNIVFQIRIVFWSYFFVQCRLIVVVVPQIDFDIACRARVTPSAYMLFPLLPVGLLAVAWAWLMNACSHCDEFVGVVNWGHTSFLWIHISELRC